MQPGSTNQQNLTQLPDIKEAYPLIQTELLSSQEWTYIWIGLTLVLALCLFYGIYRWMKRPQAEASLTPIECAWKRLETAEDKLTQGDLKAFSQTLSLALRAYIEASYRIPALELTTEEFSNTIRERSYFNEAGAKELIQILETCDALKFSTAAADKEALQSLLAEGKAFIRAESVAQEAPKA